MKLFRIVVITLITLSICVCLYYNKETFTAIGGSTYYCPSRTTRRTMGRPLNQLKKSDLNSISEMQTVCTNHPNCSFFTCDAKSKDGHCENGQLYAKGRTPVRLRKQQVMYTASQEPCNKYCLSYVNEDTKGRKLLHKNARQSYTMQQAKNLCDQKPKCSFFTCDAPTNNTSGRCSNLQLYTDEGNVRSLSTDSNSNTLSEMYEKTYGACLTTVPSTHAIQNAKNQAFTLPYPRTVHNGLAKYSNVSSQLVTDTGDLPLRKCTSYTDGDNKPVLSEVNHDSNCFLNDRETRVAHAYIHNTLNNTYSRNKPYSFFKDSTHNVFMRKTDSCCAPDVQTARKRVRRFKNKQLIELPDNHPCNNLTDSVFAEHCNHLCKKKNHVYRSDLKACVPKKKKCWFKNSIVCDINSPFRANFNDVCSTQPCRDDACRKSGKTTYAHACKDGLPYYTYVGTYNDVVAVEERLRMIKEHMNTRRFFTYNIVDPQNDKVIGRIENCMLGQRKIRVENTDTKKKIVYKVVSFSPSMQYIELHKQSETANKTRHYIVEEHNLLADLEKKVKDSSISVIVLKKNQKPLGEIIHFTPYTMQLKVKLHPDNTGVSAEDESVDLPPSSYIVDELPEGLNSIVMHSQNQYGKTKYSLTFTPKSDGAERVHSTKPSYITHTQQQAVGVPE